jgi:hypothetical protein
VVVDILPTSHYPPVNRVLRPWLGDFIAIIPTIAVIALIRAILVIAVVALIMVVFTADFILIFITTFLIGGSCIRVPLIVDPGGHHPSHLSSETNRVIVGMVIVISIPG